MTEPSKRPWRIREHPANPDQFIIWAERNDPAHPYDIEIMGEDTHPDLYPVAQKRLDAELIVTLANQFVGTHIVRRRGDGWVEKAGSEVECSTWALNHTHPERFEVVHVSQIGTKPKPVELEVVR